MNLYASYRSYRMDFEVASVSDMPEDHNKDIGRGREGGRGLAINTTTPTIPLDALMI